MVKKSNFCSKKSVFWSKKSNFWSKKSNFWSKMSFIGGKSNFWLKSQIFGQEVHFCLKNQCLVKSQFLVKSLISNSELYWYPSGLADTIIYQLKSKRAARSSSSYGRLLAIDPPLAAVKTEWIKYRQVAGATHSRAWIPHSKIVSTVPGYDFWEF